MAMLAKVSGIGALSGVLVKLFFSWCEIEIKESLEIAMSLILFLGLFSFFMKIFSSKHEHSSKKKKKKKRKKNKTTSESSNKESMTTSSCTEKKYIVGKKNIKSSKQKNVKAQKKNTKIEADVNNSDDEFNLSDLLKNKNNNTKSRKSIAIKSAPVDNETDKTENLNKTISKSSLRRLKKKEKKAAAIATENVANGTLNTLSLEESKASVDNDGFQTVVLKKRRRKKAVVEINSEPEKENMKEVQDKSITEEFPVDPKLFGVIIGPGGKTLNMHQEACNVRISVPDRESDKHSISITGNVEDIKAVKKHLKSLIDKGYSSITNPDMMSSNISVSSKSIGLVIGPGGKNIKSIQEHCSVKIKTENKNDVGRAKIVISGLKENVMIAKSAIKDLVKHGFCEITHPGWIAEPVEFPSDELSTLIGPNGHTIKSIQGDTKTKINISKEDQSVVVVGERLNVSRAVKQIMNLLIKKAAAEKARQDYYNYGSDYDSEDEYYNNQY